MPRRPLPKKIVERLRTYVKAQEQASKELGHNKDYLTEQDMKKLPNLDHRKKWRYANETDFDSFGGRIRELNIGDEHSPKAAIKRVHKYYGHEHTFTGLLKRIIIKVLRTKESEFQIKAIRNIVLRHNKIYGDKDYILYVPEAYAVGDNFILMEYLDAPCIEEINAAPYEKTSRGERVFEKLKAEDQYDSFVTSYGRLIDRLHLPAKHIVYLGFRDGKHEFVPLVDIE